jgi:hypothetical protein
VIFVTGFFAFLSFYSGVLSLNGLFVVVGGHPTGLWSESNRLLLCSAQCGGLPGTWSFMVSSGRSCPVFSRAL